VSLYHYLKGRTGFGESGDVTGNLIRERDLSILDIYEQFGGAAPEEDGPHQAFADFFNGQTRAILGPHFPTRLIAMTAGQPDGYQAAARALSRILADYYVIGSTSRYDTSVKRFAAKFDWTDLTIAHDNATPGRPALDELSAEVIETIRAFNAIDDEFHQQALSELNGLSEVDGDVLPEETDGSGAGSDHGTEAAAGERDVINLRGDRIVTDVVLANRRAQQDRLEGASSARDRRMEALAARLERADEALAAARADNRALDAQGAHLRSELEHTNELLAGLMSAGRALGGELGLTLQAGAERPVERAVAALRATIERARARLEASAIERRDLEARIATMSEEAQAAGDRESRLMTSVRDLQTDLAQATAELARHERTVSWLVEERREMVGYARSVATSHAWRYGHGASRIIRRVTLRRVKKRDGAAEELLKMLEAPPQLPAGGDRNAGLGEDRP
jgi:hypothetical protein